MRILLLALSGLLAHTISAQEYVPLFGEPTRMWNTHFFGTVDAICEEHDHFTHWLAGDTLINDTAYDKVVSRGWHTRSYINAPPGGCSAASYYFDGPTYFVREMDRKVHARYSAGPEWLIYDFTAEVGDTVPHPDGSEWSTVLAIDSVEVNGTYRKRYTMEVQPWWGASDPVVIEGIGGAHGPFSTLNGQYGLSHFVQLECVMEHGVSIHGQSPCSMHTGLRDHEAPATAITLLPNPSEGRFTIGGAGSATRWTVCDLTGAEVATGAGDRIDISARPPGLYLLRVWSAMGTPLGTHRLLVAR